MFHQKADTFSAASRGNHRMAALLRKPPRGVSDAALTHWCKLGLALAAGQCGSQGPSGPFKLAPAWEQTKDKQPYEATEARQVHRSRSLWENAAGTGETGDD